MAVSLLTQDDHVDDDDDRSHNDYYELQFPSQVSLHYISSAVCTIVHTLCIEFPNRNVIAEQKSIATSSNCFLTLKQLFLTFFFHPRTQYFSQCDHFLKNILLSK